MSPRPVEIIGGGLAGLSLGLALARAGTPVTLIEAGDYPRHRVCGEFIAGLNPDVSQRLGLAEILTEAKRHRSVTWFHQGETAGQQHLDRPALGISRFQLDHDLAAAFIAAGGKLLTRTRVDIRQSREGRVLATGRRPAKSPWVGVKMHVRDLRLRSELELHLAPSSYVGLCEISEDVVNVCGLFHRRHLAGSSPDAVLEFALERAGLGYLRERLHEGEPVASTLVTVAGLDFDGPPRSDETFRIGDAHSAIPPFSGHGMALAFQSAAAAIDPLTAWSEGRLSWDDAIDTLRTQITQKTKWRFRSARFLHPWLLSARRQRLTAALQRRGWVPLKLINQLLHA